MFRQVYTFTGGWKDKTIEALQKRKFEILVAQLHDMGTERLENLSHRSFERKLERCWQNVEKKPIRKQQEAAVRAAVLGSIERQADCLSFDEHELVERALILGGRVQIDDATELEAAHALSLRLWGNVGLVSGKPVFELDPILLKPVAKAFSRAEHETVRMRFAVFHGYMTSLLYQAGAVDDRVPQKKILRDVLEGSDDEIAKHLARRYLWASYDCLDYDDGVLLVHGALAEPRGMVCDVRRRSGLFVSHGHEQAAFDILPEEIPLQTELEYVIASSLRENETAQDIARMLRFLCKQGAPLSAMEEVLQSVLIVRITPAMRKVLRNMYYVLPKWTENGEPVMPQ